MDTVIFAAGLIAHAFVGDSLLGAKCLGGEYLNKLCKVNVCGLLKNVLNT